MTKRKNYTSFATDVQSTENGFFPQDSPPPPSLEELFSEPLPEIKWLDVGTLTVDERYQHPLYDHAVQQLAKEFHSKASGFILVNIRDDGTIAVIDGMTRVRVHQNGMHRDPSLRRIRAEVCRGMTLKEEAEWYRFKGFNIKRQPTDMFKADCVAEVSDAVQLLDILTQHGLRVQPYAEHKSHRIGSREVSCIASLRKLLQRDQHRSAADILHNTFTFIMETWPDPDETPLTKLFIDAIYDLITDYEEKISLPVFKTKLGGIRPLDLRVAGQQLRLASTPYPTLRKALKLKLIELYNLGQSQEKRLRVDS